MTRTFLGLGGVALSLALAGCGTAERPFVPVTGKIMYKGEVLKTGSVVFVADASKGNTTPHEPRGIIDEDGICEIITAGKPGAPAGWYLVGIYANKPQDRKNPYAMTASLIPKTYNDARKSNLTFEVPETGSGTFEFELK